MAHKLRVSRVCPWPEAQPLPSMGPCHREKEAGTGVALEMDVPDGSPGHECGVGQLPHPSPPTVPPPASLSTPSSGPSLQQAELSDSCPHSGLAQGKAGWGLRTQSPQGAATGQYTHTEPL